MTDILINFEAPLHRGLRLWGLGFVPLSVSVVETSACKMDESLLICIWTRALSSAEVLLIENNPSVDLWDLRSLFLMRLSTVMSNSQGSSRFSGCQCEVLDALCNAVLCSLTDSNTPAACHCTSSRYIKSAANLMSLNDCADRHLIYVLLCNTALLVCPVLYYPPSLQAFNKYTGTIHAFTYIHTVYVSD